MATSSKLNTVAPPTIGFLKGQGVTATRVFCASIYCGRMAVMAFDDLGLPDETPFPSIKNRRRWSCERCGNHEVSVMPSWRDPRAVQAERVGQTNRIQSAYGAPSGGSHDGLLHLVQRSGSRGPGG